MAEQYIFTMLSLNKFYGKQQVLKDINLCFFPGAKIGIVGENGSGKSTVLRVMAELDDEFQGQAFLSAGYRSGIVLQDPVLDDTLNVRQTIEQAFKETTSLLNEYNELTAQMATEMSDDQMQKAMDRMGQLQDQLDARDGWNLEHHLSIASDALCLPEDDRLISSLSGGEKRRVALCKALLEKPDLLLLDEPTNHLDAETVAWLEEQLKEYPGTVIIVTHDRYFLDNITKWILELDSGAGIPYEGNYSSWLEQKLTALSSAQKKESPKGRALARELAWIKMSSADRHRMSQNRIKEYEQLVARETSAARRDDTVIQIAPGPDLGSKVIEFDSVSKQYDDLVLLDNTSFKIPRSAVVGLIGPNGSGKTTLLRMLLGEEDKDSGQIDIGSTVKFSYVEQGRERLDVTRSLIDEVGNGLADIEMGKQKIPIRKYLSQFGFKGADQQKTVGQLSGGEQNRCNLAKVMKAGGNVLLLDEPTNDLDVNTLRMLEDAINNFSGCVLVISHDRYFLDRICTHLIVFEGEGKLRWFEGNFQEYEQWRIKELGGSLLENRRSRYRKLVKS